MSNTALRASDLPIRDLPSLAKRTPAVHKILCDVICYQFRGADSRLRAEAARDETPYDSEEALQEACEIDPAKLPSDAALVLTEAFGAGSFRVDHEPLLCEAYKTYEPVLDSPVPKNKITEGLRVVFALVHTRPFVFVPQSRIDALAAAAPCKCEKRNRDDDDYVTVKIKIGKGGRQMFKVPRSEAKDMQGDFMS